MIDSQSLLEGAKQQSEHFRADIEGLRALALLLVLLFHLEVKGVSGGYVGVDVFFVISGFVVTRTLWPKMGRGDFRLRDFYVNRFWRLQPSVALLVGVTLIASAFLLSDSAFKRAASSGLSALALVGNFFFYKVTSGYDSHEAAFEPLLHTWSLGVEEQFYLLWPLALLFVRKQSKLVIGVLGAALLILGAVGSELLVREDRALAYYLLPARVFELCLGALLVCVEHRRPSRGVALLAALLGLGLVLASALLLTERSSFPGLTALIPCVGTAFLIHAGGAEYRGRALFTNPFSRFIGRISYAWYLWHWPGIALLHCEEIPLTLGVQAILFLSSFALAIGSYALWETPLRRGASRRYRFAFMLCGAGTFLFALSAFRHSSPLVEAQDPEAPLDYRNLECLFSARSLRSLDSCRKTAKAPKRLLIWGDSHARAYHYLIQRHAKELGWTSTMVDLGGCPPIFKVRRTDTSKQSKYCQGQIAGQVDRLLREFRFDGLLLVGRYSLYEKGNIVRGRLSPHHYFLSDAETTSETAEQSADVLHLNLEKTLVYLTSAHDLPIIWALPTPVMPRPPGEDPKPNMSVSRNHYEKSLKRLLETAARFPDDVLLLDPRDAVCEKKRCPGWDKDVRLYIDDDHLSHAGGERLLGVVTRALHEAETRK